ncbi:MAG TPA: deoxyribonuclease IV [Streptosporangiaceae bacterium]|nr:deoxyribonuclease IV [Streptosporangiaceae bacterium]
MVPQRPIGAHVLVAGGLAKSGLRYAAAVGAEAIQVFVSNPRGWALTPGDPAQDAAFARYELPVFVHASYLVNLGSPDPKTADRSVASLRHALRRGAQIGARGVVVHTGSAVRGDRVAALRQVRELLLPLLDGIGEQGPDLLLESMAGKGHMLCAAVGDFGPYLDALDRHPRAAICLDTCHVYAAGHDLAARGGVAAALDALHAAAGPGRLKLVHANDSRDPCGSRRDRHEHIGAGHIGKEPFSELLGHPATAGISFIVETPEPAAAKARDVATLKALRARARAARTATASGP